MWFKTDDWKILTSVVLTVALKQVIYDFGAKQKLFMIIS